MADSGRMAVGVDIGGTHLRVGAVRGYEVLAYEKERAWSSDMGPDEVMDIVAEYVRTVVDVAGLDMNDVEGVGVGIPGRVDHESGEVIQAVNASWARETVNVKRMLELRLGLPVMVDHDVAVAAAGEYIYGGHGKSDYFLYVTLGTGIASCYIANGKLLRGAHNSASEMGHTCIDPDGPRCVCGMAGCLERLAAGPAIARAAGMRSEEVVEAARNGEPRAVDVMDRVVNYLALGFVNVINVLDPDVVVIGGGLSQVEDVIVDPLRMRIRKIYRSPFAEELEIKRATFGDDAGIIGAAAQFGQEYADLG